MLGEDLSKTLHKVEEMLTSGLNNGPLKEKVKYEFSLFFTELDIRLVSDMVLLRHDVTLTDTEVMLTLEFKYWELEEYKLTEACDIPCALRSLRAHVMCTMGDKVHGKLAMVIAFVR